MGIRSQNNPLAAYLDVFSNTGTDAAGEPVLESGLTASGGFVNDYTEGGIVYRAHIFTTNSQFQVTALGDYDNTVQYLVVGGGGGGGNDGGGGGGAGGVKSNHPSMPSPRRGGAFPVSVSNYPVYVGQGGRGGYHYSPGDPGQDGEPSRFGPTVIVLGGGGGGGNSASGRAGGSSGGGGQGSSHPAGATPDPNQGFAGGNNTGNGGGAGGGGAGGVGGAAPPERPGGVGLQFLMAGPPTFDSFGAPGPNGGKQWFAGGGGGGGWPGSSTDPNEGGGPGGPYAGAGDGGTGNPAVGANATANTGGGGGGSGNACTGGAGGKGVVIIRYKYQ